MQDNRKVVISRKSICVRLLYSLLFLVVFEILKLIIQITVVFQYIYLLLTLQHHDSVRKFSNKVSTYTYDVMRYLTLNKNQCPFPFNDFPAEMESPVDEVIFR